MQTKWKVPIALIAGGVIIAAAVYLSAPRPPAGAVTYETNLLTPLAPTDHIFGNPTAPIKIIEYSDFDCTYCKAYHDTLHQIVASEGTHGAVAWVFREFPLTEIHPTAAASALAAECAGAVGGNDAFWAFADALYAHQPADPSTYGALAAEASVPGTAFASCYSSASSTLKARVSAERANALAMGADGTPFVVLLAPGQPPRALAGAYSYDALKQIIDQDLKGVR
jgi:protein-disulfide isomerase